MSANDPRNAFRERIAAGSDLPAPYPPALPAALIVEAVLATAGPATGPAAFIHPCQPIVAKRPPTRPGWAHELKHDGYRLQIHVRDGRVRLYTINGVNWSKSLARAFHRGRSARVRSMSLSSFLFRVWRWRLCLVPHAHIALRTGLRVLP
jgi:hypothetical protein